jgi:hypothetical protein
MPRVVNPFCPRSVCPPATRNSAQTVTWAPAPSEARRRFDLRDRWRRESTRYLVRESRPAACHPATTRQPTTTSSHLSQIAAVRADLPDLKLTAPIRKRGDPLTIGRPAGCHSKAALLPRTCRASGPHAAWLVSLLVMPVERQPNVRVRDYSSFNQRRRSPAAARIQLNATERWFNADAHSYVLSA